MKITTSLFVPVEIVAVAPEVRGLVDWAVSAAPDKIEGLPEFCGVGVCFGVSITEEKRREAERKGGLRAAFIAGAYTLLPRVAEAVELFKPFKGGRRVITKREVSALIAQAQTLASV